MRRATIAGIIFQAAQVAALIFTGGVVGIGTYYALQYGFFGLGLLLSLQLLGKSRNFEIEADILRVQYLWNAGYNNRGFIDFFDKMAQEKGYVRGMSWFRTHPPFYQRMEQAWKEKAKEGWIELTAEQKAAFRKRLEGVDAKVAEQVTGIKEWLDLLRAKARSLR